MLTIHSPQFATSSKADLLSNKLSPSCFRNKRIPSAQDNYSCSSNKNLKISKTESPSKFSEEIKRRKSQYIENNPNASNRRKCKANSTQHIISSINQLKQQYQSLKDAYRDLIQEKVKSAEEIIFIKAENKKVKLDAEKAQRQNQKLKLKVSFMEQEMDRAKRQFCKLIQAEKFRAKKLEESLNQKQQYINQTLVRMENQSQMLNTMGKHTVIQRREEEENYSSMKIDEESLTISQDKEKTQYNQSQQLLSFSLTSVLEESTYKQDTSRKRKQHLKVLSDLTNHHPLAEDHQLIQIKSNKNKDHLHLNFKKLRKEIGSKLQINIETKDSKPNLGIANLSNLLGQKTPMSVGEKKVSKNKSVKSKRKEEQKQNVELKYSKKKSKKVINLSTNE